MASTTKYTAAPQQDPDESHVYTQAPPSYQAESSSANDEERLFGGGPRSSEDNVPDDFKVRYVAATSLRSRKYQRSGGGTNILLSSSVALSLKPPSTSATSLSERSTPS